MKIPTDAEIESAAHEAEREGYVEQAQDLYKSQKIRTLATAALALLMFADPLQVILSNLVVAIAIGIKIGRSQATQELLEATMKEDL